MAVRDVVQAAAGVGGAGEYIEDVFSTYLYTGNGSTQTITNGIDLAGEGGLVWFKARNQVANNALFDTERGTNVFLKSNVTDGNTTRSGLINSYNSNGFTLGNGDIYGITNYSGSYTYASWTFRKAPKFFDVVTYTGNGVNRTIAHNLGSVPGCIIVKRTDGSNPWAVYHRGASPTVPEDKELQLNATDGAVNGFTTWNRTLPTDTVFSVGTEGKVNENGWQYVAYLFAHDAGGFGDDGEQNVISCGSYVGAGSGASTTVNLGYEPQWVLVKPATTTGPWSLIDNMRGWTADSSGDKWLEANTSGAEYSSAMFDLNATGFATRANFSSTNSIGQTYIYIAIRRPMKTPESGTEVFAIGQGDGDADIPDFISNFPVDAAITKRTSSGNNGRMSSRLTGANYLSPNLTQAESADGAATFDFMNGWGSDGANRNTDEYAWMFRRAPSVFDVVCWTGNLSTNQRVSHNLGVLPELIIYKGRNKVNYWRVYFGNINKYIALQLANAEVSGSNFWGSSAPTTTDFGINCGSMDLDNFNAVAYLFATLPGVSKVGSYSGTGATQTINCGFSAGARFVLIKRTDSTGDWYIWDSARGIVAGNDPYLLLNSTAAEVTSTDYIDPVASGFEISSSAPAAINASGGSFIFFAVA